MPNDLLQWWLRCVYESTFKVIGFFYRTYTANRNRVKSLLTKPRIAMLFRAAMLLTIIAWFIIWYLAPEDRRDDLTDTIQENLNQLQR